MFIIHFGLIMFMTIKTSEVFFIQSIRMTGSAFTPFVSMFPGKNREIKTIVLLKISLLPRGMTGVALTALIRIPLNADMFCIRIRLVVFMAGETGEILSVRRI